MRRSATALVAFLVAWTPALTGAGASASSAPTPSAGGPGSISYRYTSLSAAPLPDGFVFNDFTVGIDDLDRVYGNSYDHDFVPHVSRFALGRTTVLQSRPSFAYVVNPEGVVGGSVLTDPVNNVEQAAIFTGGHAEIIARRPGEASSKVVALNRNRSALVASTDESGEVTYAVHAGGRSTVLDFGPRVTHPQFLHMNDAGFIAGTAEPAVGRTRAFRYSPVTRTSTLLSPLPTESTSWGLGINNRLDVVGYSFTTAATERIGVWDFRNKFHQYFIEGTAQVPTISNRLLFNEQNLIVITGVSSPAADVGKSFMVPRPGVRLNVADLVDKPPAEDGPFHLVTALNDRGSMIGLGITGTSFLLRRER